MQTLVGTTFEIHTGHKLSLHAGECKNTHGHTYKIEVEAEGEIDPRSSMVIDFETFRATLGAVVQVFDHAFLVNEHEGDLGQMLVSFLGGKIIKINGEPTTEKLAHLLATRCYTACTTMGVSLRRVRVWETSNCYACVEM